MPSYSTSLKLELMDNGSNSGTWGNVTNTNLGTALEQAIVGKADITMSSTTVTLTLTDTNSAQNARAIYLNLTGSPGGAAVLEVPAVQKPYIVKNGTNQQVTIKVTGQTGVVVPTGKTVLVYNNGTDVVTAVDHIPSLTLGAALPVASGGTGITAFGTGVATALGQNVTGSGSIVLSTSPVLTTPDLGVPSAATLTNATDLPIDGGTTGTLPVGRGGTGASTLTANNVLLGNGTSAVQFVAPGTIGNVLTSNGTTWTSSALSLTVAANNAFTGANTFYNSTGQTFGTATSTQDGIIVAGRAGGSSSYRLTFQPGALSASRTVTFPDGGGNYTVGYRNIPAVGTKTSSYTLATADVGKYVQIGSGGSIIIPDATFAEGDVITIFNNTTGNITITCSITTAYIAGNDADQATMVLGARGVATILFISSTVCVVSGNVA